ncbi:2-oxoglutarate ferredoxin oxidoreductase subunit beta [Thermodesulfobium acidiphilum]|uniref:2-oxoglutarate ferredoxin oxidoreductase subunit beta n=1 Tax=Thermodesulfobium acidiphilum TaxID=1794699 RepID=A0A2R4VZ21_THEAF|nr:thiamine pyrophosphate-dependent enzyme [Thermodesulfobium acidiphilum]AWB09718.1 2-oxoglutarate ferredoxin oxidoreductase subunit beta [Thermodesulfobium acidiphilum]
MSNQILERPRSLTGKQFHYCPGCHHGIIHRLIAETIDEFDLREKTIVVQPVGCAVYIYEYFDTDVSEAAHGRAPAVATAIKRVSKDKFVLTYQGDGDLAAIGTAEIVHAAARGENICVFFVNNAIYGMTGGQMAPTTLPGMKTATTPFGRDVKKQGYPIRVSEMLAPFDGVAYVERVMVSSSKHVIKAKNAVRKAFKYQLQEKGFSLVEFLSACPTGWGMPPVEAAKWVEENMAKQFPLGVYKEVGLDD